MSFHMGDDAVECVVPERTSVLIQKELECMAKAAARAKCIEFAPVVRCKDCVHAFELADNNAPYDHRYGALGFYCNNWDMDMYMPEIDPEKYFCADGKRRNEPCT